MESDAEFKNLIQEVSRERELELILELENQLRLMEQNIKGLLSIKEDLPEGWRRDYKRLCMTHLIASPYGIMRTTEAMQKVGGRELSTEEFAKAVFGDYAREFLDLFPEGAPVFER